MNGQKMDETYEIPAGVVARNLSGEMVILDLEKGKYFGLNEVGTRIWEQIGEGKTVREITDAIVAEFEVSLETAGSDIKALLVELEAMGLVVPHR
jgi:Coenzyme PQQ synthesis protein D (PqqD)